LSEVRGSRKEVCERLRLKKKRKARTGRLQRKRKAFLLQKKTEFEAVRGVRTTTKEWKNVGVPMYWKAVYDEKQE